MAVNEWNDWDWIYALNLADETNPDDSRLRLYPLQLANCERLRRHSAVYIFDEVGIGKTISAGLMALDYLYNHYDDEDKDVLVITIPALARGKDGGQFLNDWCSLLPFRELRLDGRIDVINNNYANIEKINYRRYGLVIIDEAHMFLNSESVRSKSLYSSWRVTGWEKRVWENLERVVFLTATPIKEGLQDLDRYHSIAVNLLPGPYPSDDGWTQNLLGRGGKDPICSRFCLDEPVTCYFKDTMRYVTANPTGHSPERCPPILWKWSNNRPNEESNSDCKCRALLRELLKLREAKENRFVIFTRLLEKEAYKIRDHLIGLYPDTVAGNPTIGEKQQFFEKNEVKVITGKNSIELQDYRCKKFPWPKVLIMTYQIAEAGVNLPEYNYVINYHIPPYPSALEQRFGRIDRDTSRHLKIHACYLYQVPARLKGEEQREMMREIIEHTGNRRGLREQYFFLDTDTFNLYCAVNTFLHNMAACLPARNALLTTELLDDFTEAREAIREYIEGLKRFYEHPEFFAAVKHHWEVPDDFVEHKFQEVIDFCLEHFGDGSSILGAADPEKEFAKEIKHVQKELSNRFKNLRTAEEIEKSKELLNRVGSNIFYIQEGDENCKLHTVTAEKCAESVRSTLADPRVDQLEKLQNRIERIRSEMKMRNQRGKLLVTLNQYFKEEFLAGRLENIFPENEAELNDNFSDILEKSEAYGEVFCRLIQRKNTSFDHHNLAPLHFRSRADRADAILFQRELNELPFFKMCKIFEQILRKNICAKGSEEQKNKYKKDPFWQTYQETQSSLAGEAREAASETDKQALIDMMDIFNVQKGSENKPLPLQWYKLAARFFKWHSHNYKMRLCFYSRGGNERSRVARPSISASDSKDYLTKFVSKSCSGQEFYD